jgi:hypothetical protein
MQGSAFTTSLNDALTPAYSLAAVAGGIPEFQALPSIIAAAPPSAPDFRNISIPTNTLATFDRICSQILSLPSLPRSVLNLQIAPAAVIAAIYPLPGNERAIGLDLLQSAVDRADVARTVSSARLVAVGPFLLVQVSTINPE